MESGQAQSSIELLAREAKPVRHWLKGYFRRRIGAESDVDDLVQEVFRRIVSRDSIEPIGSLNGYVMKVAANVLTDNARQRSSRHVGRHVEFDADLHGDMEFDPERVLTGKEELDAATSALLSLPERTRTVFILRRLEGWRFADVAKHLGISVSAAEKHMVKAIRHLSDEMERRHAP
ncbi:RNA polymerase sigma factor [Croceibacterium sp. LX-88]|uniref:RNA polymerase sigma factor n=1 Tax=Croceibacterium selenioxidans TaxID=2838833 RepID=A0ABS5W5Q0_9SPHN|nr:RNA polymerase sigma factor [Croceibacterium selenioxidans]MBT2134623.1 RNA polymerase sigma factor [Croceibacterium selenioxidans]